MTAIVDLAVRRPRTILAVWLAIVAGLGVGGAGIEGQLHLTNPIVSGTASARAQELSTRTFGDESTFVALLEGSAKSLNSSGPRIINALGRIPHVSAVSPWIPDGPRGLRPNGETAVAVLGVHEPFERAGNQTAPRISSTLARTTPLSIRYHLVGYPQITAAIRGSAFTGLKQAELTAAILLAIMLLLVFRSPVAAGVPLFLGLSTVATTRGLLAGVNVVMPLDVTALSLGSMFGLALGVDYSLLLVSRFREQLAEGEQPADAARTAARTAGHTVLVAGFALLAALSALYFVAPEQVTSSASIGSLAAVLMSVIGAQVALPAVLTLLGTNVNRWQFGRVGFKDSSLVRLAWRLIHHPLLVAAPALILLLALGSQALSAKLSPPNETSLPHGSPVLASVRAVDRRLGSGWITPYEVLIHANHGLVTDPRILYAVSSWQTKLEKEPSVAAAIGPRTIYGGEGPPSATQPFATQAKMTLELLRDAPPEQRPAATLALNLDRGGTTMRMVVVERMKTTTSSSADRAALPGDPLRRQLVREAGAVGRATGTQIVVGGPASTLQDFTAADQRLMLILVGLLSLITFLILLFWIRALPIALAAVALNVVTVGATVGVLVLCFEHPGLGANPHRLGAAVIPGVIAVSFALAIDYEVFLLARIREGIKITGDNDEGLHYAMNRTAGIITGAALIMCAVFVAFGTASLTDLREYGVGLAVAVIIDATIVRLVLLPTLIRLLGRHGWWLPTGLERVLARLHLPERATDWKPDKRPQAV
jgi:RND superfamily putative drug exporter